MSLALLEERLGQLRRTLLAPPPKLTVSEWADRYRVIPSYSAEPGPWRTSRVPYLREIMDSFSDPTVNEVVFMKCARIGGTEAGLNMLGYFIHQDPSHILIVQPTVDDAKDFSKEHVATTIADTPSLRVLVKDPRSRDSANTVQSKLFPGGGIHLVGANSPRGFRRRTARVLVLEEVDGYEASAGSEGDPVKLAEDRVATYTYRRKIYKNSTPTLKGLSKIETAFAKSDQRRYYVPCPDCGHLQPLVWSNLKFTDLPEPLYACASCGVLIPEERKPAMLAAGEWRVHNPGALARGYHINALYSPWVSWSRLRDEWLASEGDLLQRQVFVNRALGEPWEERTGALDPLALEARRETYPAEVPAGVGFITAGVDVQVDRLEVAVRGWGAGEESWRIRYDVLLGDTGLDDVWQALEDLRRRTFAHESGAALTIGAMAIDTGYQTDRVYRFAKPRFAQRVYATKGSSAPGAPMLPHRPSRTNKLRCPVFLVGTDAAKDLLFSRLKLTTPGPLYMHFDVQATRTYFEQLTAERAERKQVAGRWLRRYTLPRGARNEALDCELGALVALRLAPIQRDRLGEMAAELATAARAREVPPPAEPQPAEETPVPSRTNPATGRPVGRGPWWRR